MTRVKICGLTCREDALWAIEYGADALGFVFAPHSVRRARPETVARIVEEVPPHVTTIGVFQDQPAAVVREVMLRCGLRVAQLHGQEDSSYIRSLALPVLKAVGLHSVEDLAALHEFRDLDVVLLDAARVESGASGVGHPVSGGTGQTFDWSWTRQAPTPARIVIGGGLGPDNVAEAVRTARPWAVDGASGTESGPGRKDPERVRSFVQRAKGVRLASGTQSGREESDAGIEEATQGWGFIGPQLLPGGACGSPRLLAGHLQASLRRRRAAGGKSLIPFFVGGYHDRDTFGALLLAAQAAGADAIEVGIPSSDPKSDGPLIRRVARTALARGADPHSVLADIAVARTQGLSVPIALMSYGADYVAAGGAEFADRAVRCGVDGLLVVDPTHRPAKTGQTGDVGGRLESVTLIDLATPAHAYSSLLERTTGFAYCVTVEGGTGGQAASVLAARQMVDRVRRHGDIPALVGFGITGPKAARAVAAVADGVVIGSALLAEMDRSAGDSRGAAAVAAAEGFLHRVRMAIDTSA